ncbi:MAG: hypothetical protein GY774_00305 [Planctomycetes bacterium]|nr:hypothetical protein [Planctomycetota bacterium]
MSRVHVIETLYEMVTTMTIARGYNFDWVERDDGERSRNDRDRASVAIRIKPETNVDDQGGRGSNQYIDDCFITMTACAPVASGTRGTTINKAQEISFAKALDDIKKRYGTDGYLCDAGIQARGLRYLSSDVEDEEKEGVVTPSRLVCEFRLKYITDRGIGVA